MKKNTVKESLITSINEANEALTSMMPDTKEYSDTVDQIERLHKLLSREREGFKVSPDTVIIVAGNLLGIALILNYEKLGIVTSKALGFVGKFR